MSEQPEALRLANFLEMHWCNVDMPEAKAAAELRRQHEEITELRHGAGVAHQTIAGLVAQRDALRGALKEIVAATDSDEWNPVSTVKARAAIKKAEEGK